MKCWSWRGPWCGTNVSVSRSTVSPFRYRTWCWRTCRMETCAWVGPSEGLSATRTKVSFRAVLCMFIHKSIYLCTGLIELFVNTTLSSCSQEHLPCAFPGPSTGSVTYTSSQRHLPQAAVAQLPTQCHVCHPERCFHCLLQSPLLHSLHNRSNGGDGREPASKPWASQPHTFHHLYIIFLVLILHII